ncbi:helix-turn-helix transcriptional regulator [Mycobacteroides abscessus subsp. bolletii]|nr:helix-turn-helix transcriptional regulator [Mycobacteroides abscessus subsp. bolletii]
MPWTVCLTELVLASSTTRLLVRTQNSQGPSAGADKIGSYAGRGNAPVSGLGFDFISSSIANQTSWVFDEPHHVIAVYTGGLVRAKETEFRSGTGTPDLPKVGDILVVPAGERVGITARGQFLNFSQLSVPTKLLEYRKITPRFGFRDPLLHHLINRAHSVADRDDLLARLLRDSLADVIRLHLSDHYASIQYRPGGGRSLSTSAQSKLIEFIEDSMDSDISLGALARRADMPVSQFSKAFTFAFHTTPYQYVLDRRIARAKRLLATTTLTVTDIAASVGFSTPSHFATAFKGRVGMTPTVYRNAL